MEIKEFLNSSSSQRRASHVAQQLFEQFEVEIALFQAAIEAFQKVMGKWQKLGKEIDDEIKETGDLESFCGTIEKQVLALLALRAGPSKGRS